MTVAAFVISVLAFLASGAAVWYAQHQAESAKISAAAAIRSAAADERAIELAEIEAAKYSPPWVLRWEAGDVYLLINDSDEAAHDVVIDLADLRVATGALTHDRIGPGSAISLMVGRTMGTRDDTTTVTWSRLPGGERLDWKHPFPRRPPRQK